MLPRRSDLWPTLPGGPVEDRDGESCFGPRSQLANRSACWREAWKEEALGDLP